MRKILLLVISLVVGIGLGLFIGWYAWPVNFIETSPADLRSDWKDEAIWLAAEAYAYDGNLELAQARLAPLGSDDLASITDQFSSGGYKLRDLIEQIVLSDAFRMRRGEPAKESP